MSIGPHGLNFLPIFTKIAKTRMPVRLRALLLDSGATMDDVANANIFTTADPPYGSIHHVRQNFLARSFGRMVEIAVSGPGTGGESLEMDLKPKKEGGPYIPIS